VKSRELTIACGFPFNTSTRKYKRNRAIVGELRRVIWLKRAFYDALEAILSSSLLSPQEGPAEC